MRVVTRRLLGGQIVTLAVVGSGKKDDAMWHVPQHRILSLKRLYDANHYSIEMRNKRKIKHSIEVGT